MPDQPANFIAAASVLQAVLNYLAQRPYAEVFELIAAVQQCKPAAEDNPAGDENS